MLSYSSFGRNDLHALLGEAAGLQSCLPSTQPGPPGCGSTRLFPQDTRPGGRLRGEGRGLPVERPGCASPSGSLAFVLAVTSALGRHREDALIAVGNPETPRSRSRAGDSGALQIGDVQICWGSLSMVQRVKVEPR